MRIVSAAGFNQFQMSPSPLAASLPNAAAVLVVLLLHLRKLHHRCFHRRYLSGGSRGVLQWLISGLELLAGQHSFAV